MNTEYSSFLKNSQNEHAESLGQIRVLNDYDDTQDYENHSSMATTAQNSFLLNTKPRNPTRAKRSSKHADLKVQVPKMLANENSLKQMAEIKSSLSKNGATYIAKGNQELVSSRSIASIRHSFMSGLEECDIPQTLSRISEYLEKHHANPKPTNLIQMMAHLVKLCEETRNFELEFHSKKMEGDLMVELRRIDEAKAIYKQLVKLCENQQKYKEQTLMFEQLGY